MTFLCPVCNKEIRAGYMVNSEITGIHHGGNLKCQGIGRVAVKGDIESKSQQKNKARVAGLNASAQHKQEKSVSNLKTYQTPHQNPNIQKDRENKAKTLGLPGHGSADSNSKKNNATKNKLNQINK
jgi:hypothetical protein